MSSDASPPEESPQTASPLARDLLASVVVFLVALPLCIGIAVACGVPAERGILSSIVGGIVVGALAGSPLLVTGPAASLIVPVFDLVRTHGLVALGPVVMLAGLWQLIAGVLKLGQWFRAVAPAVILGMLIGIGVLITGSQLHVAIDSDPLGPFLDNLLALGPALVTRTSAGGAGLAPVIVGVATISIIVAWNRFRPKRLELVPGHLLSLTAVTATVALLDVPVRFLDISPQFFSGIELVSAPDMKLLLTPAILKMSFIFAFVASAATLLTATAIDQRQSFVRTNYNREMLAQGVGNLVVGALGGLPMTGVIVRSSVNVDAGARTRRSTIFHGVWLVGFVAIAPQLLERIPRASLGAILVYTGIKLVNIKGLKALLARGRTELAIALITLFGVVFIELFDGIMLGLAAAIAKLIYSFTHLEVRSEQGAGDTHHLHLAGSATFLRLPLLAEALEQIPVDRELHVHVEGLSYIDHACLELLSHARKRREQGGQPELLVEWDELAERYDRANTARPEPHSERNSSANLLKVLWREWRRLYGPKDGASTRVEPALSASWLTADRIRLGVDARKLGDILDIAAELLAPAVNLPVSEVAAALRLRNEDGCMALVDGVGLPHTPLDGVVSPRAALLTSARPIQVGEELLDVFFVLLAPTVEPRLHLVALAQVGRLCHDREGLRALRRAASPQEALRIIQRAEQRFNSRPPQAELDARGDVLVVIDLEGGPEAERALIDLIAEGYPASTVRAAEQDAALAPLTRLLGLAEGHRYVVLTLEDGDAGTLRRLLSESARLLTDCNPRMHLLRRERAPAFDALPP